MVNLNYICRNFKNMIQKLIEYQEKVSVYEQVIKDLENAKSIQSVLNKYKKYLSRSSKISDDLKKRLHESLVVEDK